MPRANLKGIIDIIPIIKAHIEGLPDRIYIYIPSNIIEKSQDEFLLLRIFYKIEQHFKIFLETCYDIYILPDKDLSTINNKYLEIWKKYNDLIPPDRRKLVEKELYEWILHEKKSGIFTNENLNFFIKYFKMSVNNLDWSKKKQLWKDLRKRENKRDVSDEQKARLILKYMKVWNKYNFKIKLPETLVVQIKQKLSEKHPIERVEKKISRIDYLKMKFCPMCGAEGGTNFCGNCGYDLRVERRFCKNCGAEVERESVSYCHNCGQKL